MAKSIPYALSKISHEHLNILEEDIHKLRSVLVRWYNAFHNKLLNISFITWRNTVHYIRDHEKENLQISSKAAAQEILRMSQPKRRTESEIKVLTSYFKAFDLVPSNLERNLCRRFCQEVTFKKVEHNEVLFFQGDEKGNEYFFVLKGFMCFYSPQSPEQETKLKQELHLRNAVGMGCELTDLGSVVGELVSTCSEDHGFGEAALLAQGPRSVTAVGGASGGTSLICVNKGLFESCLMGMLSERYNIAQKLEYLHDLEIFKHWTRNSLVQLCCNLTEVDITKGNLLLNENTPLTHTFLVAKGQVSIFTKARRNLKYLVGYEMLEPKHVSIAMSNKLCMLGRGSIIGDLEVLKKRPFHFHTVQAVTNVKFYQMTPSVFTRFLVNHSPKTFGQVQRSLKLKASSIKKNMKDTKRKLKSMKNQIIKAASPKNGKGSAKTLDTFAEVADAIMKENEMVILPVLRAGQRMKHLVTPIAENGEETPVSTKDQVKKSPNPSDIFESIQPVPQLSSKMHMLKGKRIRRIDLRKDRPTTSLGDNPYRIHAATESLSPSRPHTAAASNLGHKSLRQSESLPNLQFYSSPKVEEKRPLLLIRANSDCTEWASDEESICTEMTGATGFSTWNDDDSCFSLQSNTSALSSMGSTMPIHPMRAPSSGNLWKVAGPRGISSKPAHPKIFTASEKHSIVIRLEGQYQSKNVVRPSISQLGATPPSGSYFPSNWKKYAIKVKGPIGEGSSKEALISSRPC
mmetsp:Transcript_12567/g.16336  ORF Transcript_12567/g.16336 Transcript_12567/m.16336 type:complete len:743 (-) Transcript_12567:398-2626(-)